MYLKRVPNSKSSWSIRFNFSSNADAFRVRFKGQNKKHVNLEGLYARFDVQKKKKKKKKKKRGKRRWLLRHSEFGIWISFIIKKIAENKSFGYYKLVIHIFVTYVYLLIKIIKLQLCWYFGGVDTGVSWPSSLWQLFRFCLFDAQSNTMAHEVIRTIKIFKIEWPFKNWIKRLKCFESLEEN